MGFCCSQDSYDFWSMDRINNCPPSRINSCQSLVLISFVIATRIIIGNIKSHENTDNESSNTETILITTGIAYKVFYCCCLCKVVKSTQRCIQKHHRLVLCDGPRYNISSIVVEMVRLKMYARSCRCRIPERTLRQLADDPNAEDTRPRRVGDLVDLHQ